MPLIEKTELNKNHKEKLDNMSKFIRKLVSKPFPVEDKIVLSAGHSLITGSVPEFIGKYSSEDKKPKVDRSVLESLGLFEVATPNFQTYYPDVNVQELVKDENYVHPIFRALSEVIVRKNYDPIDFTKNGVLKASMNKLVGQTVYPNHEAMIGNEIGAVKRVFWEESYKTEGLTIPAGINAEFKINAKAHPKIASGILSDPPEIHSNSVTVFFAWEPSHKNMNAEEFRYRVGTYDDKGQLIRRIVTEIKRFNETSLVPHGADPFAQLVKNGKINNAQYAYDRDSLSEGDGKIKRFFGFSYKDDIDTVLLSDNPTIPSSSNNENPKVNKMDKELILLLALASGIELDSEVQSLSDDEFKEKFDLEAFKAEVASKKESLTELVSSSTKKDQKITELEAEVQQLKEAGNNSEGKLTDVQTSKINLADKVVSETLAEVQRLYKLVAGDKPQQSILDTLAASDYNTLRVFEQTYKTQLEDKFPATCSSCGSHEISMGSVEEDEDDKKGKKPTAPKNVTQSLAETRNKVLQNKQQIRVTNI